MRKSIKHFFADIKTDLFHSSLLLSGSLVAQIVAFAAYPVLTRLYSPGQFGQFSVFLSIAGILAILATGRLEYALMIPKDENEAIVLKKISLWWCFLFSTLCLLISLVLGFFKGVKIPGLYFLSLYVFLMGIIQIFTFYRNRLKQYKKLAQVSVLQNAVASGSKVLLGFSGFLSHGLIWGSVVGQLVSFMAVSKGFLEKALFKKPENYKAILQKYSVFPKYRMVQALVNSVSSNMPIFFITFCFSAKEAGYFALILGIGYKIITLVSAALYQVLYRRFTEEKNLQRPTFQLFGKILLILAVVSIIPGIPVFFLSKSMITLFFGQAWADAAIYLKIMLPWLVLVFMTTPFAFIADIFSLQKKVLFIDILYLFLRIFGFYIGVWIGNVYVAVTFLSLVSIAYLIFFLTWYYLILKKNSNLLMQQESYMFYGNDNSY